MRSLAFARESTATHSLRNAFSFVLRYLKDMSLYGSPSGAPCNSLRKQQQKALRNKPTSALYFNKRAHPFSRVVVRCSIKDILRENPLHSLQKSVFPSVAEFLPFVPHHAANITGQSGMQWLPLLPGAAARPLAFAFGSHFPGVLCRVMHYKPLRIPPFLPGFPLGASLPLGLAGKVGFFNKWQRKETENRLSWQSPNSSQRKALQITGGSPLVYRGGKKRK